MLGCDTIAALRSQYELIPMRRVELDVTNGSAVDACVREHQPDAVLHLAAMTNVDYCEEHPEEAYRVNSEGTRHVAAACAAHGATMIYVSTIAVFGGDKQSPYSEASEPSSVCRPMHLWFSIRAFSRNEKDMSIRCVRSRRCW